MSDYPALSSEISDENLFKLSVQNDVASSSLFKNYKPRAVQALQSESNYPASNDASPISLRGSSTGANSSSRTTSMNSESGYVGAFSSDLTHGLENQFCYADLISGANNNASRSKSNEIFLKKYLFFYNFVLIIVVSKVPHFWTLQVQITLLIHLLLPLMIRVGDFQMLKDNLVYLMRKFSTLLLSLILVLLQIYLKFNSSKSYLGYTFWNTKPKAAQLVPTVLAIINPVFLLFLPVK